MDDSSLEKHLRFAHCLAANRWPWHDRDDALSHATEAVWRAWQRYPDDPCGLARKIYRRRQLDAHRLLSGPQRREPGTRHDLSDFVLGLFGRFAPEPPDVPPDDPEPDPGPARAEPCRTCRTPFGKVPARSRRPERVHGNCRQCHEAERYRARKGPAKETAP